MDKKYSSLAIITVLFIAFLGLCLTWMTIEYLNLENINSATMIRLEERIKNLEIKADDIVSKLNEHAIDSRRVASALDRSDKETAIARRAATISQNAAAKDRQDAKK